MLVRQHVIQRTEVCLPMRRLTRPDLGANLSVRLRCGAANPTCGLPLSFPSRDVISHDSMSRGSTIDDP
jgi:hypothetical protein